MQIEDLGLNGALLIKPAVHGDERGVFMETYRREEYRSAGIVLDEMQMNLSHSGRGVVRGIHFQLDPGQPKLVSCVAGDVFNVVVDLRKYSPTFGQYQGVYLSAKNAHQLYLPVGFGNGFVALSDFASYNYIVGSYYNGDTEEQIAFNDPDIGIKWPVEDMIFSKRDAESKKLADFDWSRCSWQK